MSAEILVIGSFTDDDRAAHAIEHLKAAQFEQVRAFAPIPSEKINEALYHRRSAVRSWVLTGGICGILTAFAITVGTSLEWNLIAGGKPIVSLAPYYVIVFELMILGGAISSVLGFMFNAKMPALDPIDGYSERFSSDRFGVVVNCASESDYAKVEKLLKEAGAEEVIREAAAQAA
jgi:hypothetical protein